MATQNLGRGKFASLLLLLQGLLLILFVVFTDYDKSVLPEDQPGLERDSIKLQSQYGGFQDVHIMLFVGFGFLMTFLRRYGFSALGYNFFLSALVVQWATLTQGFFDIKENKIKLGFESMIKGDLAAVAVVVTFGAVLGKTSQLQLLVMAFIEVIFYAANVAIGTRFLQAVDAGNSIYVHVFGAYFGLAVARALFNSKVVAHDKETSRYTSDLFATLGTIFLWVFWPSFNAVLVEGSSRYRAILNTYYAMAASCVTSCAFSSFLTKGSKVSMVHVQNATLAGGVAIGTTATMIIQPWGAVLIGLVSGALSTIGFKYVQPFLIRRLRIHDTCGVNSLHGLPGILAAIASSVSSALADFKKYKTSLYTLFPARAPVLNSTQYIELVKFAPGAPDGLGRSASLQAGFQFAALVLTIALAVVGGLLTGLIIRHPFFDPLQEDELYDDGSFWEVPDDFNPPIREYSFSPRQPNNSVNSSAREV